MTEATATPSPGEDRRKKQVLLQKRKARNAVASGEASKKPATPEQQTNDADKSPSPSISRRATAYVSRRRKQSMEKRRNKITSPSTTESPVKDDGPAVEVASSIDEEKKEHIPRASSKGEVNDDNAVNAEEEKGSPQVPAPTEDTTRQQPEEDSPMVNSEVEENTAISPKDRNDRVEVDKKSSSWDTRSIHEFPPEPAVDPTWDTSKTLFDEKQEADIKEQMDKLDTAGFDEKASEFSTFDAGSWPVLDATKPEATEKDVKNVNCSLDVDLGVNDDGLATNAAQLMSIVEGEDVKPSHGVDDGVASDAVSKQVDCSMDVHMGVDNNALVTHADRLLKSGNDATNATDEVDFSATDLDNPANALKGDEALLASDQVRSDVAGDGAECDVLDAIRLLNQVEHQKRIEQYNERSEDDSSAGDEEDPDESSDEEDFEEEDEIHYISADSEEEEELARHDNSSSVPDIVGDTPEKGATFGAAAAAALDAGASKDRSQVQLENLAVVNTNSSSSASVKGDSTAVESSVASSALFGAGVLSLAGTSVNTEVTESSVASRGPQVGRGDSAPPPPPSSSQPPKKKTSSQSSEKQKPLLKIPPPAPEKLRKWEEEKMRPFKHLQAVADAKVKSSEGNLEQEYRFEEAPSSEYASLSLMTNVSSSHSQEEVETTLDKSLADEYSTMISDAERNEKKTNSQTRYQLDETERSAGLDESQVTQKTQDMSFPDARSVTSFLASSAVLSPPHVSRTKLDEAAGLAPGEDGVWKEESLKKTPKVKNTSPMSDNKMAERLAVASSTAARKFEEKYGDIDEEAKVGKSVSFESQKKRESVAHAVNPEERPDMSYFCSPDMLGAASFCQPDTPANDDGNLLSQLSTHAKEWASMSIDGSDKSVTQCPDSQQRSFLDSSFDDTHHAGMELVGGAFSTWKNSDYAYGSDAGAKDPALLEDSLGKAVNAAAEDVRSEELRLLSWLENDVLHISTKTEPGEAANFGDKNDTPAQATIDRAKLQSLLQKDANLNTLCGYASVNVIMSKPSDNSSDSNDEQNPEVVESKTSVIPFLIPTDISKPRPSSSVLAANFISFLNRVSLLSGIESPFKDENPFLMDVVSTSLHAGKESDKGGEVDEERAFQDLIFQHELGDVVAVVRFFYQVCVAPSAARTDSANETATTPDKAADSVDSNVSTAPRIEEIMSLLYTIPTQSPSPFETAAWNLPSIVAIVLGFLGDPVTVCRMKMVNHFCNRLIQENEHVIMRDSVRLGGIGMHIRPAFWMWITLEKCGRTRNAVDAPREGERTAQATGQDNEAGEGQPQCITTVLPELEKRGREGKWHHVIQRDVARAFGNMPPHKTGARLRTDSIVRALVTWGQGRVLSRGVKGGGVSSPTPVIPPPGIEKAKSKPRPSTGPPPWERGDSDADKEEDSQGPPETVSQWSGISPVPSFCSNSGLSDKGESGSMASRANLASGVAKALERIPSKQLKNSRAIEELALSGNTLTAEMKEGLQNQLGYILHALAAAHEDVGYCQGMDYVVAHLLRVLQDTVRWHSVRGTLSPVIKAQPEIPEAESDERSLTKEIDQAIDSSLVVEETVFRVMDTFLTTYNLRHMYWPELRCLKTCCRVFERLIQMKLPVLADHFAYHELNVGLFALGWFQTLFLYLPSMPSATVCHMWDIWLVERSFKIFYRVGTAILFLSQPILLNHELEGIMTYLNTFPDATLLNPDILIACALQIKVTNRMLADIERDLTGGR